MRALVLLAIFAAATPAAAVEIGLSGPAVYNGDVDAAVAAAHAVAATGTTWARVNFRLDVWSAPDDATARGPQALGWFAAYDRIVDTLTQEGVQVYGEIGAESVPGGGEPDSDDYVQRYAAAFVQIVDHFKDRARVYETFNEPNNWRSETDHDPAVSPYYLAKMQQEIYLNTKYYNGRADDPCDQVAIVSGALLSLDGVDASDYLAQVYDAGRGQLAWDWMHEHVGTYPMDGVGYHVYVGQDASATTASIAQATQQNLDAIWSTLAAREPDGAATEKRIWLTELGWTIDQVSPAQQADFLGAAYDVYAADPHVAAAFWFTYQDFPGGRYGLYDDGGLDPAHRRPDYDAFVAAVARYPPARNARFLSDDVPATLAPGETRTITLAARNLGAAPWSEAQKVRLGAAAGCPAAAATNAFAFAPAAPGYANGVTDARVALAGTVAPGADATWSFAITAPATPGDYVLGARLVQDGVAWFGDTFRRTIHVAGAPLGPAGTPADGAGGSTGPGGGAPGGGAAHLGCVAAPGAGGSGLPAPSILLVSLLAIFCRHKKPLM